MTVETTECNIGIENGLGQSHKDCSLRTESDLRQFLSNMNTFRPAVPGRDKYVDYSAVTIPEIPLANELVSGARNTINCFFDIGSRSQDHTDELHDAREALSDQCGLVGLNLQGIRDLLDPITKSADPDRTVYYDRTNQLAIVKPMDARSPELVCGKDRITFVFPAVKIPRFYEGIYEGDIDEFYNGKVVSLSASLIDNDDGGGFQAKKIKGILNVDLKETGFATNRNGSSASFASVPLSEFTF
jgi:hypothetical protein